MQEKTPFEILGLSEDASKEAIDRAYSDLMARFSEDNYLGSPLWDMAAEKRRDIEKAYHALTGAGETLPARSDPAEAAVPSEISAAYTPSTNVRVRSLLNSGDLEDALSLLNEQSDRDTNPEWLYLRGMANWKRGWVDEAYQCVKKAAELVPTNKEYQTALEKLRSSPVPLTNKEKDEMWTRCCCANGPECVAELCCGCLCEGVCDLCDGC